MQRRHFSLPPLPVVLVLLTLGSVSGCGGSDPVQPMVPQAPAQVGFPEGQVPRAAGWVDLTGLTIVAADIEQYRAHVGEHDAAIAHDGNGSLRILFPLFLDSSTKRSAVPKAPVRIRISRGSETVAESADFVLEPMLESPGAANRVMLGFGSVLTHMSRIYTSMPTEPGAEEQALRTLPDALIAAMDLEQDGPLADMFNGIEPEDQLLLDSMLASSGAEQTIDDLVAALTGVEIEPREAFGKGAANGEGFSISDRNLARMMQLSVYAKRYAQWFLTDTSGTYSTVNTILSWSILPFLEQLPTASTIAAAVNAYISLLDLIVNKFVVAHLPTKITALTLDFVSSDLAPGAISESTKLICVQNEPPAILLTDYIGQFVNLIGFLPGPAGEAAVEIFLAGVLETLDLINTALSTYAASNPGLNLETDLYSMPLTRWTAEIVSPELIDLVSSETDIVALADDGLEWEANETTLGFSDAYYRPSVDEDAIFLDSFLGLVEYNSGAFGDDIIGSDHVQLAVVQDLVVEVDFPETITPQGAGVLGIRAGYRQEDQSIEWTAGLGVELTVTGGTAEELTGSTDADGQFNTIVRLADGSDQVTVEIAVFDGLGTEAMATATADADATTPVVTIDLPPSTAVESTVTATIRAGNSDGAGAVVYEAGMAIVVGATPGSVSPSSGVTDANGYFVCAVTTTSQAGTLVLNARATNDQGSEGTASASMTVEGGQSTCGVVPGSDPGAEFTECYSNAIYAPEGVQVEREEEYGETSAGVAITGPGYSISAGSEITTSSDEVQVHASTQPEELPSLGEAYALYRFFSGSNLTGSGTYRATGSLHVDVELGDWADNYLYGYLVVNPNTDSETVVDFEYGAGDISDTSIPILMEVDLSGGPVMLELFVQCGGNVGGTVSVTSISFAAVACD